MQRLHDEEFCCRAMGTMLLTKGRSAVTGQPEVGGQLQLLRGAMAQLLCCVSMALTPAPACMKMMLAIFIYKQRLHTGLQHMSIGRHSTDRNKSSHRGAGCPPAFSQSLLNAGPQLDQVCLHLLLSSR